MANRDEISLSPAGDLWRVNRAYQFQDLDGNRFTIEDGFKTDLGSTPRILWPLFPPFGRYTAAAAIHDWLYRGRPLSRIDVDRLFLRKMIEDRTRMFRAVLMYFAVRAFGWIHWHRVYWVKWVFWVAGAVAAWLLWR